MIHQENLTVQTSGHGDIHRLDDRLEPILARSGMRAGLIHLFGLGSTLAIVMLELEPGLARDLPAILDKLMPPGRDYGHEQAWQDGNAHSHLQASILGPSFTVPLKDGRPVLGTWQQVILLECDNKPRTRTVMVTVSGE